MQHEVMNFYKESTLRTQLKINIKQFYVRIEFTIIELEVVKSRS